MWNFNQRKPENSSWQQRYGVAETAPLLTTEPAKYWRDIILRMYPMGLYATGWQPGLEPSNHIHIQTKAEAYYTNAKQSIEQSLPSEDVTDFIDEAFIMAVLLFTYGRLDVVTDILTYNPDPRVKYRELRKCFWYLMPQDDLKNIWPDTQKTLAWFESNKHKLCWDPEQEHYYTLET